MTKRFKPTEDVSDLSKNKLVDLMKANAGIVETEEDDDIVDVVDTQQQSDKKLEKDFNEARTNIKDVIEKMTELLDGSVQLAKASDHPRAFEVAGNLANSIIAANLNILDAHEKKKKIEGVKPGTPEKQTNIQNNTVFVGSQAELLKLMREKKNDE